LNEPFREGETLKDVHKRVIPYFEKHILPDLKHSKNVLIAAHGNSLRALMKELDHLSDPQVESLEMPFGEVIVYTFDKHGKVEHKEIRKINTVAPPA
jgi:2,3-bisphosphoglycerate-dependent phosphoglycerate mutase